MKLHQQLSQTLQKQSKILSESVIAQAINQEEDDFDARSGIYYYELANATGSVIKKVKDTAEERRGPAYYSPKYETIDARNSRSFNVKLTGNFKNID
eukprot:CAMPEP_0170547520 /NCGR_PEP_ID=MMETSP0211-20121228/5936_1 /TAXON_ID=311385 /ORGANISM="Pseudokeronopsis sp., Strain OXSARD2" /LENGTH=96 /DNA_ID=CAMNT_0010852629 /DNA_START=57 /DNA_END=347 /DNA_ORIENTATION=+